MLSLVSSLCLGPEGPPHVCSSPIHTCFCVASSIAQSLDGFQGAVAVLVLVEVEGCPGLLAVLSNSNLSKKRGLKNVEGSGTQQMCHHSINCLELDNTTSCGATGVKKVCVSCRLKTGWQAHRAQSICLSTGKVLFQTF